MAEKPDKHRRASCCSSRGHEVDFLDPQQDSIHLVDIAEGLSKCARYAGQTPDKFYSVAEHSVLCSYFVPEHMALQALLHDAAEAYTGDFSSPLKALIRKSTSVLDVVEDRLTRAIFQRFGVQPSSHTDAICDEVHDADFYVFVQEQSQLMPKTDWWKMSQEADPDYQAIQTYEWRSARHIFIARFNELFYGTQRRNSSS